MKRHSHVPPSLVISPNLVHYLVGAKSKDTTKPKIKKRKDLLLAAK